MTVPQPFQYQGSKRELAPTILRYLPKQSQRIVEPFAGSAALSLACAARGRARAFWLNDSNQPLAELLGLIAHQPDEISNAYADLWRSDPDEASEQFYRVRDDFNCTHDARLLLYLLARCVKGAVRYNSVGAFNQSPDNRRLGTRPSKMRENISRVSLLLRHRTTITSADYRSVLSEVGKHDVVYMDPPYQGVCGERDSRYSSGISFGDFVTALDRLNHQGIRYAVSYDGRLGARSYGEPLPGNLDLTLVELKAGRSSQATLLGRDDVTVESLHLSRSLADEVGVPPRARALNASEPMQPKPLCPTAERRAEKETAAVSREIFAAAPPRGVFPFRQRSKKPGDLSFELWGLVRRHMENVTSTDRPVGRGLRSPPS